MQDEKFIVAIELGSSRAKIGIAGYNPDEDNHKLTVYNTTSLPTNDSIRYGRIHNPRRVAEVTTALLDEVQKKYPIEGRSILGAYISIGGRSLKSHRISAQIVLPERREITGELLERLEAEARKTLATSDELLCVEPVRFTVDNIATSRPEGTLGKRLSGEYTAITCNSANRSDIVDVISERVGLNIRGISVRPLALARLLLTPQEIKAGCMLVDFGAETITVCIYKDYALQYIATIPIGSRLITSDIAKMMALTDDEAEQIKVTRGNAMPEKATYENDNAEQDTINSIITARLADIVANITAQPGFAGMSHLAIPGGVVLTGGGARMRNFARLLETRMHLRVRLATLPVGILITDPDMSTTDNMDLLALLSEGVGAARRGNHPECVTAPPSKIEQPQPSKKPETPVSEKKDEATVYVDFIGKKFETVSQESEETSDYEFTNDDFNSVSDDHNAGNAFFEEPSDNDDWLCDSDDEEQKRQRRIEQEKKKEAARRKKLIEQARAAREAELKRIREEERKKIEEKLQKEGKNEIPDKPDEDDHESRINKIINKCIRILNGADGDQSADM